MTPERILITGGAGFVGSGFAHWVASHHPHVYMTVLDSLTYAGKLQNLAGIPEERLRFVRGDICDCELLEEMVAGVDAVVHFAAESHADVSIADPERFVRTNVYGTFRLLEAARKHQVRFHHVSTDEVFGSLPLGAPERFTESSPYRPSSPYSSSKASSDMLVRAWVQTYGVRATISNCSNNYGPRQHVEKFIPRQITNILSGARPQLYGDGLNVRDWIHVDDHASAIWAILTEGTVGESYLVGADNELSNLDVVTLILQACGRDESDYDLVPDRPGHDRRYAADASKLREELGWRPAHTDFAAEIRKVVEWYRTNADWWREDKAAAEEMYRALGR